MAARRWSLVVVALAAAGVAIGLSRVVRPSHVGDAAGAPPVEVVSAADVPVLSAGPAPSVSAATGWLNTPPVDGSAIDGRVVLYDFWTFGCINCQHTLPYVEAWHRRYAADGLVVLSIHTPEFEYEADPGNVAAFADEHDLTFPIALDPDRAIWHEWGNHYWPAFWLYDGEGRLRLFHVGEGSYGGTEDAIRALLGVDVSSPRAEI